MRIQFDPMIATSWSQAEIRQSLGYLADLFGKNFRKVFRTQIRDRGYFDRLMHISTCLRAISHLPGFREHVRAYGSGEEPASFVTFLAAYLVARGADMELEKLIPTTGRTPDLFVKHGAECAYLEAKTPLTLHKFHDRDTHWRYAQALKRYIVRSEFGAEVYYKSELSDEQLHQIGEEIEKRLPHVTQTGILYAGDDFELHATGNMVQGDFPFGIVEFTTVTPFCDENVPGHSFMFNEGDGQIIGIGINGPSIDYDQVFRKLLKKTLDQAPKDAPFFPIISMGHMLGNKRKVFNSVSRVFTPDNYKRYTGVIFADFAPDGRNLRHSFHTISNPYSSVPMKSGISHYFI